jgi:manganese/zinc/iron transport system substrate-binding protein
MLHDGVQWVLTGPHVEGAIRVNHVQNRLFAILTAAVIGARATAAMAQERLEIVATTGMIADAAREVGGDLVRGVGTDGSGRRPACLSPDPQRYRRDRQCADLVLWHGLYLEAQMEDFLLELGETRPLSPSQMIAAQPADFP